METTKTQDSGAKEKELWRVCYNFRVRESTHHLTEEVLLEEGYYDKLKAFWERHSFSEVEKDPLYKVREAEGKSWIEFFLNGGFYLPLKPASHLEGGLLVYGKPITLIAPDGTAYESRMGIDFAGHR